MSSSASVAIVGMACLLPQARSIRDYWANILDGAHCIEPVPENRWRIADYFDPDTKVPDKTYSKLGGFIPDIRFDALEFGLPPQSLKSIDVAQLFSLVVSRAALRDAGCGPDFDHRETGIVLGMAGTTLKMLIGLRTRLEYPLWRRVMAQHGVPEERIEAIVAELGSAYPDWTEDAFPGFLGNVVASRVANRLDFGALACTVDAACGSSLCAVNLAIQELIRGKASLMIAGGVDTDNSITSYVSFSKTPALTSGDAVRAFDAAADGTLISEGVAMVVLKRLEDAERDNDRIYAVIKGVGSSSDGRGASIFAPSSEGQARALRAALHDAKVDPVTVGLIEAHATGTRSGDVVEVEALREVYGDGAPGTIALGSVKSQIGHTKAAAGAAGLIKAALAVYTKALPPTLHVNSPNPAFDLDNSSLYVNSRLRPWLTGDGARRRAGVSAFGFGGTNHHLILEEHDAAGPPLPVDTAPRMVLLSASDPRELGRLSRQWYQRLTGEDGESASRALIEASRTPPPMNHSRLGFVSRSGAGMATLLGETIAELDRKPDAEQWSLARGVHYRSEAFQDAGEVVALFPGQGSQYIGMGTRLATDWPEVRHELEEFDRGFVLAGHAPLSQSMYPPPAFTEEERSVQLAGLTRTLYAQGSVGAVSMASYRILKATGFQPRFCLGHSFGELTALWAAGSLDDHAFRDLVRARGSALTPPADCDAGTLMAVHASAAEVEACLAGLPGLGIANVNGPRQIIVGGTVDRIDVAEARFEEAGLLSVRLPVAAAFHTDCVAYAHASWSNALASVQLYAPGKTVFANSTGEPYPADPEAVRKLLLEQPFNPVYFARGIEACYAEGGRIFVEIGPRAILSRLVRDILGGRPHLSIAVNPDEEGDSDLQLRQAILRLRVAGVPIADPAPWPMPADDGPQHGRVSIAINAGSPVFTATTPSAGKPPTQASTIIAPDPSPGGTPAAELMAEAARQSHALMRSAMELHERFMTLQAEKLRVPIELYQRGDEASLAAARALQDHQAQLLRTHELFLRGQSEQLAAIMALVGGSAPVRPESESESKGDAIPLLPSISRSEPAAMVAPATRPIAAAPAETGGPGRSATLFGIVSEKTGWPTDMLDPVMSLEADLGIDSIKRVEIFTALRNRLSTSLGVKELAKARTLGEVLRLLDAPETVSNTPVSVAAPNAAAFDTTMASLEEPPQQPAISCLDAVSIGKLLINIVAEKSGYPSEFLDLGTNMEADLGIDSIKRVEIVSMLRKKTGIPASEAKRLATARRLDDLAALAAESIVRPPGGKEIPATQSPAASSDRRSLHLAISGVKLVDLPAPQDRTLAVGGIVLIHGDGTPTTSALVEQLRRLDRIPVVLSAPAAMLPNQQRLSDDVHQVELSGADEADLAAALGRISRVFGPIETVIHLQPADAPETQQRALLLQALMLAKYCAESQVEQALQTGQAAFVVVTRLDGCMGIAGDRGTPPMAAGVAGLVRTLAIEHPLLNTRAIDIDPAASGEEAAALVMLELASSAGVTGPVGWRDGVRRTLGWTPLPGISRPILPDADDVVVVTGGARGVTAACAVALAEQTGCRMVLLGRTPRRQQEPDWAHGCTDLVGLRENCIRDATRRAQRLHPQEIDRTCRRILAEREVESTLARLAGASSIARYVEVDITDGPATAAALAAIIRDCGAVTGLIHGAGALADSLIATKTPAEFQSVFGPKVDGLTNVLAALDLSRLKHIALFSSTASIAGNAGQADYAMANEVLNVTAHALARMLPSCRVVAFDWGPWQGGMVSPDLERRFAERGISAIPLAQGAAAFVTELGRGPGAPAQVMVEMQATIPALLTNVRLPAFVDA
jgi:acyl transferase domain-containing protein/NAD(P)-dependent dehydrogenase (short-subunit alcohol dehydrogenase family)/acyl carrier protein